MRRQTIPRTRLLLKCVVLPLLFALLTGCTVGDAPPTVVCDSLNNAIYTIRMASGFLIVITVIMGGASYLGQKWVPINIPIGATIFALIVGVLLIVQAPSIASTFITLGGGTIPDVVAQCGIT